MPSDLHELLKGIAADFLREYMKANAIDFLSYGSMTMRREERRGGVEGDESFYVQHYRSVVGRRNRSVVGRRNRSVVARRIDLAVHPPPDLAVEIDLSPPAGHKQSVYARLGVPEIWRWRDGRLAVLGRAADGTYAERERSVALPEFPLSALSAELGRSPHDEQSLASREFGDWCRATAKPSSP